MSCNESCHTHEWVMSHMIESHVWIRRVTHMNESCHTYQWVMSHTWMSHVAHMNESIRTNGSVSSHGNTLQHTATHCNTLQRMSQFAHGSHQTCMSHVAHGWVMSLTRAKVIWRVCIRTYMYIHVRIYRCIYILSSHIHTHVCMCKFSA